MYLHYVRSGDVNWMKVCLNRFQWIFFVTTVQTSLIIQNVIFLLEIYRWQFAL